MTRLQLQREYLSPHYHSRKSGALFRQTDHTSSGRSKLHDNYIWENNIVEEGRMKRQFGGYTTINKQLKNSINKIVSQHVGKQHRTTQLDKYFESKEECYRSEYRNCVGRSTGIYHFSHEGRFVFKTLICKRFLLALEIKILAMKCVRFRSQKPTK